MSVGVRARPVVEGERHLALSRAALVDEAGVAEDPGERLVLGSRPSRLRWSAVARVWPGGQGGSVRSAPAPASASATRPGRPRSRLRRPPGVG